MNNEKKKMTLEEALGAILAKLVWVFIAPAFVMLLWNENVTELFKMPEIGWLRALEL